MKTPEEIADEVLRNLRNRHIHIADAIRAERELTEEARRQFGCCDVCGFSAWRRDGTDPKREHCQFCAAQARIAELEKALEPFAYPLNPRSWTSDPPN